MGKMLWGSGSSHDFFVTFRNYIKQLISAHVLRFQHQFFFAWFCFVCYVFLALLPVPPMSTENRTDLDAGTALAE